jgi:hypothetical protein
MVLIWVSVISFKKLTFSNLAGRLFSARLFLILSCLFIGTAYAGSFNFSHEVYLRSIFGESIPVPKRIWVRDELKEQIAQVLQHRVGFLRTRYWKRDVVSVWILDEIGKDKPITTAVVLEDDEQQTRVREVKVLNFRESRGWEVKYPFFTDQFKGISKRLGKTGLNQRIDGITGATLSVNALKKQTEVALLLNHYVNQTQSRAQKTIP